MRQALRDLRVPQALARNPLARGATPEERVESLRVLVERAADAAFGDTPEERLLRQVLVRGYLDPAPSHELAAEDLHLSRSSYFRRLRAAVERVAEYVAMSR